MDMTRYRKYSTGKTRRRLRSVKKALPAPFVYDLVLLFRNALGDYVLRLEAFRQIAEHYRGRRVLLIAGKSLQNIISVICPFTDVLYLTPDRGKEETLKLLSRVRADTLLDAGVGCSETDTALIGAIQAKRKIFFSRMRRDGASKDPAKMYAVYTDEIPEKAGICHTLETTAHDYGEALGFDITPGIADLTPFKGERAVDEPYFLLNFGVNSFPPKAWAPMRLSLLADWCSSVTGLRCVLSGTAKDEKTAEKIKRFCKCEIIDLCGQTDIAGLISLIGNAEFVLGNDSGTTHIAAACGTDSFSICSAAFGDRFLPYPEHLLSGTAAGFIKRDVPCSDCMRLRSGLCEPECLEIIRETGMCRCVNDIRVSDAMAEMKRTGILERHTLRREENGKRKTENDK